jgi:hypothetical protein
MAMADERRHDLESTDEGAATVFVVSWNYHDQPMIFYPLVLTSDRKIMSWREGSDRIAQDTRRGKLTQDEMKRVQGLLSKLAKISGQRGEEPETKGDSLIALNFATKKGAHSVGCTGSQAPAEMRELFVIAESARRRDDPQGASMFSPFAKRS